MDPILTGATANLTSKAAKGIFQEARRYIRYAFIYKKNVNKFEENRKTLMAKREGVQQEIGSANRKAEKIKADVEDWCNRVDKKMEEEEKKVKDLHDKAKNKCCIGLCPNINRRYQLSRQAEEVATAFDGLRQQGEFNRVSYQDVPEESVGGPPKDFEAFESRQEVFNDIMEALKDATIGMIGVYGMPGVGKTTLVNEVSRQVKKGKLFDAVITAVVKQRPDIRNIQDQIAESVGLKFEEQSVTGRARRLCGRLKKEKKIVVILDDLWARLDLKEVGIPFGDDHRGCSLLLTSRDQTVLTNGMDVEKIFLIDVLKKEEAWGLFKKMAGDNFESSELHPKATEAADKCAGSPLAIATVGRALRNKNLYAWNDALRKLQRPSTTDLTGILEHAYSAIKLSYDYLSEELKQTFLLYSLLGRHVGTLDLLKYSMGLGLFHGVNTVEETRDRLLTVLSDLKASCLLDDCKYCIGHLVMHDLTYDAALAIASKENNVFALKHADVLRDWPDRERMKMFNKISLKASISKLPEGLHCPQLSFFQLFSKDPNNCVEMPSNFFKDMENIKVLDLTRMHFSSLPSSIRVLSNLRTLCLDICVLEDIALVGELKTLETLSLMKSDIKVLPQEIGQLTQLKLFDLTGCTKLKMIPPGVLSRLSGLEELYMGNSFVDWEAERQANQQTNATLAELKLLSCLTSLEIHIPDAEIMPEGLFSENLRRYKVFIGKSSWDWDANKYEYSRTLRLELDRSIDHLDHGIKMLLKKTEDLYLDDMRGAKIALHGLLDDDEGFQHLKNLQIRNCADIQYIINDDKGAAEFRQLRCLALESVPQLISFSCENKRSSKSGSQYLPLLGEKMVFHFLENLRLSSINVEMIWNHPLSNNSFSSYQNLTSLIVEGCGNLKQLLSSSMARSLVKLEYFEISGCKKLKEIIFFEEGELREEEAAVSFPQLKSLKIKKLQLLMGFCSQDYRIEFPSLKLLEIEQCPKLKQFIYKSTAEENKLISSPALFDDKVGLPNVEKVRITHLRMKKIWNNQLSVNSFCKLTDMSIKYCQALATIFPCDMWSTFQRLQALRVCGCDSLEEIFDLRSLGSDMEETQVLATQFRELHIHDLPKLKQIWSKDPRGILTFEKLDVVQVLGCGSLEKVFPASVARALSQLKDLDINDCGVKEIVSKEEGSSEERITFKFDKLSSLTLWDLKKLKCFYPGLHTIKCPKLIKLKAWHCNNVRIFGTELMNDDQRDSPIQAQQPLFLVEKVLTNLEEVCLDSDEITMISTNKKFSGGPYNRIHKTKALHVHCYGTSDVFPITFLERFSNLEKLEFGCCNFKELFGKEMNTAGIVLPFKNLILNGLYNLKHAWEKVSGPDPRFPNLETLEVVVCDDLLSLGSSSAPFQNLMTLDVSKCKAMINLVASPSAVKSLVQLKVLKIRNCPSMKEIVGNEEGHESTDDIIFNRLQYLQLWNLPSLVSFCSGNYTLGFPSLEQVVVIQCPELEIFCKGVLNAPLLRRVQATEEGKKGQYWGGDLNTTIEQLYTKEVAYQGVNYLLLSDFHKSISIWKENLEESLDFTNLQVLEVTDCSSLTYIFTIPMALSLVQLEEIKVANCPMLEQIITNGGAEDAAIISTIMLSRLETVRLESCSSLTSFFLGSCTMECPSLEIITVADCPKMLEFTFAFPRMQDMETIDGLNAPFFNDKILCPNLETLTLSSLNIQKIWPAKQHATCSNVQDLKVILVHGCHRLKYLFLDSLVKNLVQLNKLEITECENLKEVICTRSFEKKEGMAQMVPETMSVTDCHMMKECTSDDGVVDVVFSKLKSVKLASLPSLSRFCSASGNYTFAFPSLEQVIMKQCPQLEFFCEGELSTPMLQGVQSSEGEYVGHDLNAIIRQMFLGKDQIIEVQSYKEDQGNPSTSKTQAVKEEE